MHDLRYILIPFITVVIAQVIKFTIESSKSKKFNWERLLNGNGGMPSSHVSFTFSLAISIGLGEGFTNPLFAVAIIFACIVAYDAMGLRMESGKQAVAINLLVESISKKGNKQSIKHLKEELGHQPLEVLMGVILSAFSSLCFMSVL